MDDKQRIADLENQVNLLADCIEKSNAQNDVALDAINRIGEVVSAAMEIGTDKARVEALRTIESICNYKFDSSNKLERAKFGIEEPIEL